MNSAVEVVVEGSVSVSAATAFDAIVPVDLRAILTGRGPLPGVVGVRDQTGPWDAVGRTRVVQLSDGSEVSERITAYEPGSFFGYRIGPFPRPFGLCVAQADGAWWFTDLGERLAHIRWSYTFALHGPLTPAARWALPPIWRPYARQVFGTCLAVAERAA